MAHITSFRHERSQSPARDPEAQAGPRSWGPEGLNPSQRRRATMGRRLSVASALLILAGGYVHLCLYRNGYRFIPKIGISFLLQAGSSAILAAALLVRREGIRWHGHTVALAQLTRLSAVGLSVGTLAALGIAHTSAGLFQFHEIGLRPAPQTLIAIVVETLAAVLLSVAMIEMRAIRSVTVARAVASPSGRSVRDAA
jgi:hypothetical protein